MGDELQSSVKILFFVNSTLPLLQVPSDSYVNPLQAPFFAHSKERIYNGLTTDLERRWNGPITIGLDIQPAEISAR